MAAFSVYSCNYLDAVYNDILCKKTLLGQTFQKKGSVFKNIFCSYNSIVSGYNCASTVIQMKKNYCTCKNVSEVLILLFVPIFDCKKALLGQTFQFFFLPMVVLSIFRNQMAAFSFCNYLDAVYNDFLCKKTLLGQTFQKKGSVFKNIFCSYNSIVHLQKIDGCIH